MQHLSEPESYGVVMVCLEHYLSFAKVKADSVVYSVAGKITRTILSLIYL